MLSWCTAGIRIEKPTQHNFRNVSECFGMSIFLNGCDQPCRGPERCADVPGGILALDISARAHVKDNNEIILN